MFNRSHNVFHTPLARSCVEYLLNSINRGLQFEFLRRIFIQLSRLVVGLSAKHLIQAAQMLPDLVRVTMAILAVGVKRINTERVVLR